MPDANFHMVLEIGGVVLNQTSYCREILLYSGHQTTFGKFTGQSGRIDMRCQYLDTATVEVDKIPFIQRFYPEFEYEIMSRRRIKIPQQGLSAHAAHAILGILRDGLTDKTEFLLYLVHSLSTEETVPYRKSFSDYAYDGPTSWAKAWVSMETLYKVCQRYMDEFDFPPEGSLLCQSSIARTFFKVFFLRPDVIRAAAQAATRCVDCGMEVYELCWRNKPLQPWEYDFVSTTIRLVKKEPFLGENHTPIDRYSGIKIDGLVYPMSPTCALGLMLNQGGYRE